MTTVKHARPRHCPVFDNRERYQSWRDAVLSASVLSQQTGTAHVARMQPDGTLLVEPRAACN